MNIQIPHRIIKTRKIDGRKCSHRVKEKMAEQNLSLRSLATRMGISAAYLSDMMRGNRNWTAKQYEAAMELLTK